MHNGKQVQPKDRPQRIFDKLTEMIEEKMRRGRMLKRFRSILQSEMLNRSYQLQLGEGNCDIMLTNMNGLS